MAGEAFEKLSLPRKQSAVDVSGRYRVYTDAENYQTVEAASALEALQASGLKQAHRIVHDALYLNNVLKTGHLIDPPVFVPKPPAPREVATVAPLVLEDTPVEATVKPPAAPLSGSDVDKLLQG